MASAVARLVLRYLETHLPAATRDPWPPPVDVGARASLSCLTACRGFYKQRRQPGRAGDSGTVVRQAPWIAACGGTAVTLLLQHVEPAYRLLGVDECAIAVAPGYLRAPSLVPPAVLAYVGLR